MSRLWRLLPPELAGVLLCALVVANAARPTRHEPGTLDLTGFARLPVVADGRIKPLDTVARTSLMLLSEKQTFKDGSDQTQPAIRWLLDVWGADDPFEGPAAQHRVFRIVNLELLGLLDLPQRPLLWRYSLAEMKRGYDKFEQQLERAQNLPEEKRTPLDMAVLELGRRLHIYEQLARRKTPLAVPPQGSSEEWRSVAEVDAAIVAPVEAQLRQEVRSAVLDQLAKDNVDVKTLTDAQRDQLVILLQRLMDRRASQYAAAHRAQAEPAAEALVRLMAAARGGPPDKANALLDDFRSQYLSHVTPEQERRIGIEYQFNRIEPFYLCTVQYVFVFVLAGLSWAVWSNPLRRAAFGLLIGTVILHTAALLVRMYLMDRPFVFVTNLYSSAVFIGWACAILGLVIEVIYRNGVGSALAAIAGSLSLVVAHFLSLDGDQLQMLQAVLDTNFWLATHVTTVTLGYSATYMAGMFGIAYLLVRLVTRGSATATMQSLAQVTYGVICFATLLSFVGTVLGGIWADQSWGRFWGWDPKENGALMIVIWNALVLHARWGGMVKQRGVAMLAVLGCVVTTWSWFGTNQLGVGLHSYGFTSGRTMAIIVACLTFTALSLLGLLPVGESSRPKTAVA